MDKREKYYHNVVDCLSYLKTKIETRAKKNLTDSHVIAEDFYKDLFNILGAFGTNFVNDNDRVMNSAFIDLIDEKEKIAIQVTSQNNSGKITGAIQGFFSKPENANYSLKVLLISKEAKAYRKDFTDGGNFNFNPDEDVIDINKLITLIGKDFDVLEKVSKFLDRQLDIPRSKTESEEVETIMALIDFLSKEKNRGIIDTDENVDPDKKIYKRFVEHSEFITSQYMDLYSIFHEPLEEARNKIDTVNSIIISSYLKDESDQLLTKYNNDPQKALNDLVEYFAQKLSENGFPLYNKQAIRFYLLDELIKCNVFPNKD
jgi:hypothetical protein